VDSGGDGGGGGGEIHGSLRRKRFRSFRFVSQPPSLYSPFSTTSVLAEELCVAARINPCDESGMHHGIYLLRNSIQIPSRRAARGMYGWERGDDRRIPFLCTSPLAQSCRFFTLLSLILILMTFISPNLLVPSTHYFLTFYQFHFVRLACSPPPASSLFS
jgi:hypothetical protein